TKIDSRPLFADRTDITRMFRNARQLQTLARLLLACEPSSLRIAIYGVADGAEAVSLLIALDPATRPVDVRIQGYDINADYLRFAVAFSFPSRHFAPGHSPGAYPSYLERQGDDWQLRSKWRSHISFAVKNVLSLESSDAADAGCCDAVLCQNLLVSLPEK